MTNRSDSPTPDDSPTPTALPAPARGAASPGAPVPLGDAVRDALREPRRQLVRAADGWQRRHGRGIEQAHLALVCLAADSSLSDVSGPEGCTATRLTRTGVAQLLTRDVLNWCSAARCLCPEEVPEAIWTWIDFLDDTGRLDPTSDPVPELRKPLQCIGELDGCGRPRPRGAPRTIECECGIPYRETTRLMNQLGVRSLSHGELPPEQLLRGLADGSLTVSAEVLRGRAGGSDWGDDDRDDFWDDDGDDLPDLDGLR